MPPDNNEVVLSSPQRLSNPSNRGFARSPWTPSSRPPQCARIRHLLIDQCDVCQSYYGCRSPSRIVKSGEGGLRPRSRRRALCMSAESGEQSGEQRGRRKEKWLRWRVEMKQSGGREPHRAHSINASSSHSCTTEPSPQRPPTLIMEHGASHFSLPAVGVLTSGCKPICMLPRLGRSVWITSGRHPPRRLLSDRGVHLEPLTSRLPASRLPPGQRSRRWELYW